MLETEQQVEKSDILKIYTNGYKNPKDFKVGLEYERLPISTGSLCSVDYWEEYGIRNLLEKFAQEETWDFIFDELAELVIVPILADINTVNQNGCYHFVRVITYFNFLHRACPPNFRYYLFLMYQDL